MAKIIESKDLFNKNLSNNVIMSTYEKKTLVVNLKVYVICKND